MDKLCGCGCGRPLLNPNGTYLRGHHREHPVGASCKVEGCDRPVDGRGLCHSHFAYLLRTGRQPTKPIRRLTAEQRFWEKVNKDGPVPARKGLRDACWLWTGATGGDGRYGTFSPSGRGSQMPAHRYSYELHVAPLTPDLEPDHLCKVTLCVNPRHLAAVTHHENVLRGDSPAAANARKTHCPNGHPYDKGAPGRRRCSICSRERVRENMRAYRQRQKAKQA